MFETAIFYLFATILVLAALRVITARNPVHAALFLVLAFFTASAIWLLLRAAVGVLMAAEMAAMLVGRWFGLSMPPKALPAGYSNTKELGRLIYTDYAYAFEMAAVVLLGAIIAAIALTLRGRKDSRHQDPS